MNDLITYVLTLTPSITAITGLIVTIMVGIKKVKKAGTEATSEVKEIAKENKQIRGEMANILAENAELKKENVELRREQAKLNARLSHMYFVEKEEK